MTITLKPELEAAVQRLATARNEPPEKFIERAVEDAIQQAAQDIHFRRPEDTPDWLKQKIAAGGYTNRLQEVVGQWPGDETDEEIAKDLEKLS